MENFIENLKLSLSLDLKAIQDEYEDFLFVAEKASHLYSKAMEQLKVFVKSYEFKSQQEEIHFFKELKPSIHSELIYYCKICDIESRRPVGNIAVVEAYLTGEIDHLRRYLEKYKGIYQYYRLKKTDYDTLFFTREANYSGIVADAISLSAEKDPGFSIPYEFKISKIMANEKLIQYLLLEIFKLAPPLLEIQNPLTVKKIVWPCQKIDLVEIIYGIYYVFESYHVHVSIKTLTALAETIFDVRLNDVYGAYNDIRSRKNNRTVFLDKMRSILEQKMQESDSR